MADPIRVTIWNEFVHERQSAAVQQIYPQGIHQVVAEALTQLLGDAVTIRNARRTGTWPDGSGDRGNRRAHLVGTRRPRAGVRRRR
jgi:hypothetical protein